MSGSLAYASASPEVTLPAAATYSATSTIADPEFFIDVTSVSTSPISAGETTFSAFASVSAVTPLPTNLWGVQSFDVPGVGADFQVRIDLIAGAFDGGSSATGTWLDLTASRSWSVTRTGGVGTNFATITMALRRGTGVTLITRQYQIVATKI